MSVAQVAVGVVGVLAMVALLGVAVLLVKTRRLRAELAAAVAAAQRADRDQPLLHDPRVAHPTPRHDPRVARPTPRHDPRVTHGELEAVAPAHGAQRADREGGLVLANREVVVATLGLPLVRVAALSHGVRQALAPANRDRIRALVRRDLRRREKLRRRAARRAARVLPSDSPVRRDLAS